VVVVVDSSFPLELMPLFWLRLLAVGPRPRLTPLVNYLKSH